jgi:hypothetical protein
VVSRSITLENTCKAWGQAELKQVFNDELRSLSVDALPLQQGLKPSSIALDHALSATILEAHEAGDDYLIRAGLFYTGMVAGCNCADDPTPQDEINEYCEALFTIDRRTGLTTVELAD